MLIVRTDKELERALEAKEKNFILEGPQAAQIVKKFQEAERKKRSARGWGIGVGILCLVAAPFTGGGSLLGLGATAGAVALSEGVILAIIGAVVSISVAAINAVKEYKIKKLEQDRILFSKK
ncbi:MAG: hypothetical protein K2J82_00295 [Muribaculaceae bacterium]|nr:hypothetical protein [Muribaculaceae bacterium]